MIFALQSENKKMEAALQVLVKWCRQLCALCALPDVEQTDAVRRVLREAEATLAKVTDSGNEQVVLADLKAAVTRGNFPWAASTATASSDMSLRTALHLALDKKARGDEEKLAVLAELAGAARHFALQAEMLGAAAAVKEALAAGADSAAQLLPAFPAGTLPAQRLEHWRACCAAADSRRAAKKAVGSAGWLRHEQAVMLKLSAAARDMHGKLNGRIAGLPSSAEQADAIFEDEDMVVAMGEAYVLQGGEETGGDGDEDAVGEGEEEGEDVEMEEE